MCTFLFTAWRKKNLLAFAICQIRPQWGCAITLISLISRQSGALSTWKCGQFLITSHVKLMGSYLSKRSYTHCFSMLSYSTIQVRKLLNVVSE